MLHYGPKAMVPNEIVVPPNSAGFGFPLEPLLPIENLVFAMQGVPSGYSSGCLPPLDLPCNSPGSPLHIPPCIASSSRRKLLIHELRRLRGMEATRRDGHRIALHVIGDHRTMPLSPAQTRDAMRRSLLCPIVQGDYPYQKRLFDAIVTGCVPLLIRYRAKTKRLRQEMAMVLDVASHAGKEASLSFNASWEECSMYSWDPRVTDRWKWLHPCSELALPFASRLDYASFTASVDASSFVNGSLAEAILRLDRGELERKRERLAQVRRRFVYEWETAGEAEGGAEPRAEAGREAEGARAADAFTSVLEQVCDALEPRATYPWSPLAVEARTAQKGVKGPG